MSESGIQIRPCEPAEINAGLAPIYHFFGRPPDIESADPWAGLFDAGGCTPRGRGTSRSAAPGAFSFTLTVSGGSVPAAGVTVVGVLLTHRRRGILRAMMRAQLDDVHDRAEPLAALWASEETIYGRFGYGVASLAGELKLARNRGAFAVPLERYGVTGSRTLDGARSSSLPSTTASPRETPGMFARTEAWWTTRRLRDSEGNRGGAVTSSAPSSRWTAAPRRMPSTACSPPGTRAPRSARRSSSRRSGPRRPRRRRSGAT